MRQGTTRTRIVSVAVVALVMVGAGSRAQAAHFVKIDEQSLHQEPKQPAVDDQSACKSDYHSSNDGAVQGQFAFVDVSSDASLAGDCEMAEISIVNTAWAIFTVVADPGDPAGPVTLCFAGRDGLAAESTAGFNATAVFGSGADYSFSAPASITRSPGAITIFSDGPTTIHSGTTGNSQSGVFSANPGDTITLSAGEETDVLGGADPGSATARAAVRLSVRVGDCVAEGAPAVSHGGLAVLVALLGMLGVVTVARRRSSIPARR